MKMHSLKRRRGQHGVTMLVVLVLLSVMLLGGMALARLTEIGTIASGNAAYHDAAMQASEVGVTTAFLAVRALTDEDTSISGWYSAAELAKDSNGLPTTVDWSSAQQISVGGMTVRYVAERACTTATVTNSARQCLVKQYRAPATSPFESRSVGPEKLDPPNSRQFRITVRVDGPKGTRTWVQSLVTRG
ncbi:MAG: hypothetical protein WAQ05_07490 [Rubrivivax sp.]